MIQIENLLKATKIINNLNASKFPLLLNRISKSTKKPFSQDEEEKLQISFELEREELTLLIQSLIYIFEQACFHIMKPNILHKYLIETLKMNDEKAQIFVNIWIQVAKTMIENLRQRTIFPNQLQDVSWNLNLQISSDFVKKQKLPKALLQLGIDSKIEDSRTDLIMQFNHEELYEFYQKIEKIQSQLDSLR